MAPASLLPTPDFPALFDSAPDSYLVLTPDLTILEVNNAYLRATMTRREEILGRGLFEVFPDNLDEASAIGVSNLRASLERVIQKQVADVMAVQKYDIRHPRSEGGGFEERYWSLVNTPVFGADGEVTYILHRAEDLTQLVRKQQQQEHNQVTQALRTHAEQMEAEVDLKETECKQAQQILQESEDRYRLLVELSPDAIFVQSGEKFVFINSAGARLLGATHPDELMGRPVLDSFHPGDREVIKQRMRQLAAGSGVLPREERFMRLDGMVIDVEVVASPLTYRGVPSALVVARDIRDRKRSEQEREHLIEQLGKSLGQREAILRSMSEGLIISDTQGNVLSMNPAALGIHEYQSVEEIQRHIQDFPDTFELHYMDGQLMPVEQWPLSRALRGETFSDNEVQVRRFDTGRVWFGNFSGTPVYDSQGHVILAIITVRDVTEQKRLESELKSREQERERLLVNEQQARQEAEKVNRMKDEFLAVLSHELRSPLNAMLGWLKLLRTREFDQATKTRAMETIERNARAQAQLIEDLLDISRIIRGQLRLNVQPISLVNVITAAIDTVQPAANAKDIRLQLMLDPSAEIVPGDADRLQQVVWNLLTNAVKFTNKGGKVEIRLERIHSHIEIIVSDTGQGIHCDFLPYVFDRFRQADSSITRSFSGLGLGLAIVRQLVELHGGTVDVESPGEGQGSTFTVTLPLMALKPQDSDSHSVYPTVNNSSSNGLPRLDGLRILVIDDEADARELLVCILEDYGAIVTAVATSDQVIACLKDSRSHVDVLVSDIGMPKEDGYTLIQRVRRLDPECGGRIPAVALTAYARAEDRKSALGAGFQFHVPKPVDPAELVVAIACSCTNKF